MREASSVTSPDRSGYPPQADAHDVGVGLAGAAGVLDGVEARRLSGGQIRPTRRVGALAEGPGAQQNGFRHDVGGVEVRSQEFRSRESRVRTKGSPRQFLLTPNF